MKIVPTEDRSPETVPKCQLMYSLQPTPRSGRNAVDSPGLRIGQSRRGHEQSGSPQKAGAVKNKRHLRLRPTINVGAVKNKRHLRLRYARSSRALGARSTRRQCAEENQYEF